ncbi:MAG: hypothetical protein DIU67_003765 [Actinomycetes bacterium]|jgi:hypothetical protein|nr:MAG: hypothetical protein DIU67_00365 [Actinomycetota bacterium]
MTVPEFPTEHRYPEESQASNALVLGVVGILIQIVAPFALWMAMKELQAIEEGRRDPEGASTARTARVLGIIGTCLFAVGFIVVLLILGFGLPVPMN